MGHVPPNRTQVVVEGPIISAPSIGHNLSSSPRRLLLYTLPLAERSALALFPYPSYVYARYTVSLTRLADMASECMIRARLGAHMGASHKR